MRTAFLFDLDGTVTKQELLPVIARAVGLEEEFRTLTRLTINGAIPFEQSFRLRFAMLRDIPIAKVRAAVAKVELESEILAFIRSRSDHCFIVTGNLREWVGDLVRHIGCGLFANEADGDGHGLTGLKPLVPKDVPVSILRKRFDRIVAIGEGANDFPMFKASDIAIAYGGVHDPYAPLRDVASASFDDPTSLCAHLSEL